MRTYLFTSLSGIIATLFLSAHAVQVGDITIDPNDFAENQDTSTRIASCIRCHGKHAGGDRDFGKGATYGTPALQGLSSSYIAASLDAYKSGKRQHMEMSAIAVLLDDETIQFMADTFAAYAVPANKAPSALAQLRAQDIQFKQGEIIATKGIAQQNVTACATCHGQHGEGNPYLGPRLAGQNSLYIASQIKHYAQGSRDTKQAKTMQVIAVKLTRADIQAVAHYYESLVD